MGSRQMLFNTVLLPIQRIKNSSLELVEKQLQTKRKGKQISQIKIKKIKRIKINSFGLKS